MPAPLRINIPPVTRALLSGITVLSLLYGISKWRKYEGSVPTDDIPYLALVPSQFLMFPWTLVSATFVERNIVTLLVNGAIMFYGGKYLERAWGSKEFAKVILVVSLIPNVVAVLLYLFFAMLRENKDITNTGLSGGIAIQATFLVAFKQLVPEHTVTVAQGVIKMRVKHFPSIFLLINALGALILGTHGAFVLSWLGFLVGWTYLRFYKRHPDLSGASTGGAGIKGDASETFAFACFFPDAMQPPVSFVADQIFAALVAVRLCTPFSAEDIASGNEQAVARGQSGLPNLLDNQSRGGGLRVSGKREEAERRRALALKALDQRLQSASPAKAPQPAISSTAEPSSQSPAPSSSSPSTTPAAPTVAPGQSMLGQTNYNPEPSSSS